MLPAECIESAPKFEAHRTTNSNVMSARTLARTLAHTQPPFFYIIIFLLLLNEEYSKLIIYKISNNFLADMNLFHLVARYTYSFSLNHQSFEKVNIQQLNTIF